MDDGSGREARNWAVEEFGRARLGDERRLTRLVGMARRAAQSPAGRVSDVFRKDAERQGAYDFLESPHTHAGALLDAMTAACVDRCDGSEFAFVPVDGTSISVADHEQTKDFGAIGTYKQRGRGLKVIDAIAVTPAGVPVGVCAMKWWTRPSKRPSHRHRTSAARKVANKETQHWLDAVDDVADAFAQSSTGTRAWFQIDREGDAWPILRHLAASGHWFTVRSRTNRRLRTTSGPRRYLSDARRTARRLGEYPLEVSAGDCRAARLASMHVRTATVTLDLLNSWTKSRCRLEVNVVFAREVGTTPRGERPLEWTLLTNQPVDDLEAARLVIFGYTQRWRIEEFHRSWKSGVCDVESAQLRGKAALMKWATLLAGVAVRVERLKQLAREQPDLDAGTEFSPAELDALILLKREQKKRTEVLPNRRPTIGEATLWLAQLGGYTGKSSGGPPGATTIARGLERMLFAADVIEAVKRPRRKR
jgi:Transposase DNA-binding/Transposase Tn5 dimerisation domain